MESVHFHLSGSEALQAAARLTRLNTGRPLLVTFGGGNHGWSDGVAAEGLALGEERYACNVLTLRERSAATLAVLKLRREEIAAVLISPLQGLAAATDAHASPGTSPPGTSRGTAIASTASASSSYRAWLHELRAACTRFSVPLIFDECATGFRLAAGGAQEFFAVRADLVCYGRALGGGLPLGAVCGPAHLLASSEPHLPLRAGAESGSGGAAAHAALMGAANAFLYSLDDSTLPGRGFPAMHERVAAWASVVNADLVSLGAPMHLVSEGGVWTMVFTRASRLHFMLQVYLAAAGAKLLWIGPGRLGFDAHGASEAELAELRSSLGAAARKMTSDGWWAPPAEATLTTEGAIRRRLLLEVCGSVGARLASAASDFLRAGRGKPKR